MIKKLLSVILAMLFTASVASCSFSGKSEQTPAPTDSPSAGVTDAPSESTAPQSPMPVIKSEADETFEKLSNEIFVSIATSDGFTYHQFVKNPASFGIDEEDIDRGWGSISLEDHEADHIENEELIRKLSAINRDSLAPINANAYDTLMETLKLADGSKDYFYYAEPLETLNGSHTMLPLMLTMYEIETKSDVDGYMYLLEDMPRYLNAITEFEKAKAERGLFMTESALDTVLASIEKFIDSGEECFLIGFLDGILEKGVDGVSKSEAEAYSDRSRECVINGILPAYAALKDALSSLRSKCSPFVGASERGEDARRYFISSIKTASACDMEPNEMADLLDETASTLVAKLMRIMYSDRDAVNQFGKQITSGDPDSDIAYLLEIIKSIYPMIPEQKVEYVDVPESVAEDFSPAAYLISAFDDPTRNIVIKNPTADTRTLLFTMAHECFPGHLYQTQYFRNGGFPLAQQIAAPNGYTEGWAVFSELMIASKAERYGVNACLIEQYNSIVSNIIIPAYISLKVNNDAWSKQQIGDYLKQYGLNDKDYIEVIYEYAVNMPDYFFNYGMGFANIYKIYHHRNPQTDAELNAFFSEYLSLGPCCYDVLFKHFGVKR